MSEGGGNHATSCRELCADTLYLEFKPTLVLWFSDSYEFRAVSPVSLIFPFSEEALVCPLMAFLFILIPNCPELRHLAESLLRFGQWR